jgi:23S rRNA (guanosine2251-2'-O)-methyltransferase
MLTIRNKRVLQELIDGGAPVVRISMVRDLKRDSETDAIIDAARERGIEVVEQPLRKMPTRRTGDSREVIVGHLAMPESTPLPEHIAALFLRGETPFFLILNRVGFPQNIGIIARTAFAAGVNGVIFQDAKDAFVNEDTLHYSMGAVARLPLIKASLFDALKVLSEHDIPTVCLDMDAPVYHTENLSGPIAFVLGAERSGISDTLRTHCTRAISLPMQHGIDSLNVSATASIILYEKVRQDAVVGLR